MFDFAEMSIFNFGQRDSGTRKSNKEEEHMAVTKGIVHGQRPDGRTEGKDHHA
jgi:hypothetical protein